MVMYLPIKRLLSIYFITFIALIQFWVKIVFENKLSTSFWLIMKYINKS